MSDGLGAGVLVFLISVAAGVYIGLFWKIGLQNNIDVAKYRALGQCMTNNTVADCERSLKNE
jgi:hypothetical protein